MAASSSTAASTSTSSDPNSNSSFDVFLNHHGLDVKEAFVRHLYLGLQFYGLKVFLDQKQLQRGGDFNSQIKGAIQDASVHVAIFSRRYAESAWCLDELQWMLESEAPIIPVFYHVEPADLWYAQALHKLQEETTDDPQTHQKKLLHDPAIVKQWREALRRVSLMSGFELKKCNDDEGIVLDKVIESVLRNVTIPLHVAEYPTGLDQKITEFESEVLLPHLQSGRKPQVMGIVGMGGTGKTTLAKELFNRKRSQYKIGCFLSDVNKGSLISLQSYLLKKLTGRNLQIDRMGEAIMLLKNHLSSHPVLLILDDVDRVDQVHALVLNQTSIHSNSLILITSRDRDVLTRSGLDESSIYTLNGLNKQHSLELFCWYAFGRSYPLPKFEDLTEKFVNACDGLPLSLKVFGSLLYGQVDMSFWQQQLDKLAKTLPPDIQLSLRISYEALDWEEKQMFLDIACFFLGENLDTAIRVWNGSGWNGELRFQCLRNKCLVEVVEASRWNEVVEGSQWSETSKRDHLRIRMHGHLRDLGRAEARVSQPRRFWRIDDLLQQSSVIAVRGIRLVPSQYHDEEFDSIEMRGLQLVDTEGILLERIMRTVKSPDLIWLCWRECPYSSLPDWIPMKKLRVLRVSGSTLETLLQQESQWPLCLEELQLDGCHQLKSIKGLAQLTKLQRLDISRCTELEELPSLETLVSLEELRVDECATLKSIRGLEKCTQLIHLNVSGCSELEKFPNMETLSYLEDFYASECVKVKSIRGLEQCAKLRHLHVSGCSELEKLPSMKTLISLEELRVDDCVKLKNIRGLLHCTKLRHLDVSGCFELEAMPSMEALRALEELWANRCVKLNNIRGLEHATKLRQLNVSQCSELEELPNMETLKCLEELWADDCVKLKNIRGLEKATKLRLLNVSDCSELKELAIMEKMPSLKILRATGCVKLKSIRGLEQCRELWMLSVSRCCELDELPNMGTLESLEEFYAFECVKLKSIQGLEKLKKLRYLSVSNCAELKELPSIETLESLEMMGVTGCEKLTSIQGLAQCTKLRNLSVSGCCELEEMPSIETLISLEVLRVDECVKLRSITGWGYCRKLRHIDVSGCSELQEFPNMETLESLEEFYASDCVKLKSIPGLGCCTKLRRLSVFGCSELEELPSMETLVTLEELLVDKCVKLKSIKGLAQCKDLRTLSVDGCRELEELPSVSTLVTLEELRVNNCEKLKSIRGLAHCTKLRHLDVGRCSELIELEGVEHCTLLENIDLSECPKLLLGVEVADQLRGRLKGDLQSRRSCFSMSAAIKGAIYIAVLWMSVWGNIRHRAAEH